MATINPSQDYDIIHTLTYANSGGTNGIFLQRGSIADFTGTVYYRAGTSGAWTSLAVSGWDTTFPITSTTMQIAHDWNKDDNDYMTPMFYGGTMTGISISQKAVLSGVMGGSFMVNYAYDCTSLTTLDIPDTSGLTSVGDGFMRGYAYNCTSLTSLGIPDTSGLTSVGGGFMGSYATRCSNLTTLDVPDTSGLTAVGSDFMSDYANSCSSLTSLEVPDTSGLTSVGSEFMYSYAYGCANLTTLDVPDTSGLTSVGNSFMEGYAYSCSGLTALDVPDTSGLTSVGTYFMYYYADGCSNLTTLNLPKAGWFKTNNVDWSVPSGRLGILKGYVLDSADLADWQALTVSGKTLYTNYIQSANDVYSPPSAIEVEVQNSSTSVVMSDMSITRNVSLSTSSLSVATAIGNIALTGGRSLSVANHTVVTSTTSPTLAAVRNLITGNLSLLVTASQSNVHKLIGINLNNLSLVTVASTPTAIGEMLLSMNNLLVEIDEDSVEMSALRSMGVEPISVVPIISATSAQIGYPIYSIGSDNIYAIGYMREGEYDVATINNNQTYEVVEQDEI